MMAEYSRFWKEMIGPFKVERRKSSNKSLYVVSRDGEYIISMSTKNAARQYAKNYVKLTAPIKTMKQAVTAEEKEALRSTRANARAEVRRNAAYNKAQLALTEQRQKEAEFAADRIAKGLPPKLMESYGERDMARYIRAMREKHGPDWKPSTIKVFGQ